MKLFFLAAGIVLFILGFFMPDKALTITIHDTYLVISLIPIGLALIFISGILLLIPKIKRVIGKSSHQ